MASSIKFDVDGIIPVIKQPKCMACWATVVTMLMSWKNKQSFSIESAMDSIGSDFRKIFDADQDDCKTGGLPADRIQDLATATGMQVDYQKCETPGSILQLLQSYGPIIIITDEDPSPSFAVHARIIKGIYGDSDDTTKTFLSIIDPGTGTEYDESFDVFSTKYESMCDAKGWNLQMMYYPVSNDSSNSTTDTSNNTSTDTSDNTSTDSSSSSTGNSGGNTN